MNMRWAVVLCGLMCMCAQLAAVDEIAKPDLPPADTARQAPLDPPADAATPASKSSEDVNTPVADAKQQSPEPEDKSALVEQGPLPIKEPAESTTSAAEVTEIKAEKLYPGPSRKEMISSTEEDERTVRQVLQRIDAIKSAQLSSYLALDKELDDAADQVGAARGKDAQDLRNVLWQEVDTEQEMTPELQDQVRARQDKVTELEKEMTALAQKESEVISLLKRLSDETAGAFDKGTRMYSQRLELRGIVDDSAAKSLLEQIKKTPLQVSEVEKGLTATNGVVSLLNKASADTRAQLNKVKGFVTDLESMGISVKNALEKIAGEKEGVSVANAQPESGAQKAGESKEVVPDEQPSLQEAKKKRAPRGSWLKRVTQGTFLEQPYQLVADVSFSVYTGLAPVRAVWRKVFGWGKALISSWTESLPRKPAKHTALDTEKKDDPVLERIRIERNQALQKTQELAERRQMIIEKEKLLDRLEVERVMQLDAKEDVVAGLEQSYARSDRELTWAQLGKRFMWKLTATARRGWRGLMVWWSGEKPPVKKPKSEGKEKVAVHVQAPDPVVEASPEPPAYTLDTKIALPESVAPKPVESTESIVPTEQSIPVITPSDVSSPEQAREKALADIKKTQTPQEKAAMRAAQGELTGQTAAEVMLTKDEREKAGAAANKAADEAKNAIKLARAAVQATQKAVAK